MSIAFAVDRLYEIGWLPDESNDKDLERLPDGRRYPSITAVKREFADAGLELSIKQNLMFKCHRAEWAPRGQTHHEFQESNHRHGTVVGSCDREAAVYALAKLRTQLREMQLLQVG